MASSGHPLLQIKNLSVSFGINNAGIMQGHQTDANPPVVDRLSLDVGPSQTVALVGESGCGKSVTALSIMRLLPSPPARIISGEMRFQNTKNATPESTIGKRNVETSKRQNRELERSAKPIDLLRLSDRNMRRIRGGRIAMIFQEPLTSLNPVFTIGEQIVEAIELHQPLRGRKARDKAVEMLHRVGIPDPQRRTHDYPHQLSGGMRQRVMIAMALACEPALLIADEPTTALDVTTQAQILDLLHKIQTETGMSLLLITHDLGVVSQIADYVYVMYSGRIVEHAPTAALFANPLHPYTQGLLRCTPRLGLRQDRLEVIPGMVPNPSNPPTACRFHPRCRLTEERADAYAVHDVPPAPKVPACANPRPGGTHDARTAVDTAGRVVLRRCVESYDGEPSGVPELREICSGHFAACWEI